jgi:hypothetical protein
MTILVYLLDDSNAAIFLIASGAVEMVVVDARRGSIATFSWDEMVTPPKPSASDAMISSSSSTSSPPPSPRRFFGDSSCGGDVVVAVVVDVADADASLVDWGGGGAAFFCFDFSSPDDGVPSSVSSLSPKTLALPPSQKSDDCGGGATLFAMSLSILQQAAPMLWLFYGSAQVLFREKQVPTKMIDSRTNSLEGRQMFCVTVVTSHKKEKCSLSLSCVLALRILQRPAPKTNTQSMKVH